MPKSVSTYNIDTTSYEDIALDVGYAEYTRHLDEETVSHEVAVRAGILAAVRMITEDMA